MIGVVASPPRRPLAPLRARVHRVLALASLAAVIGGAGPADLLDPAVALNREGIELYEAGKTGEAAARFSEANARAPGRAALRYNLATALSRMGQHEQAVAAFHEAEQEVPPELAPDVLFNLGNTLMAAGDTAAAADAYREALRRDPAHAGAKRNLELALATPPPPQSGSPDETSPDEESDEPSSSEAGSPRPDPSAPPQEPSPDEERGQPQPEDGADEAPAGERPPPGAEERPAPERPLDREQAERILRSFEQLEQEQLDREAVEQGPDEAPGGLDW